MKKRNDTINKRRKKIHRKHICYICKKGFSNDKKIKRLEIIVITQENIEELLMIFAI